MRFQVPNFSRVCCLAMESTIVVVRLLVQSSFLLVSDSIVLSYHGSWVVCIPGYVSLMLLATCSVEAVIEMPCMENFNQHISPSTNTIVR